MLKINSEAFIEVFYWFSRIEGIHVQACETEAFKKHLKDKISSRGENANELSKNLKEGCQQLIAELDKLGARVTLKPVRRMLQSVESQTLTFEELGEFCQSITSRFQDEISEITLLALNAKEQALFAPTEPLFGKDFEAKFPMAVFELDEAAKCRALGRSTAAVFHLMRAMEIGVRAVARSLQIPDPLKPAERNWGHILKGIWDGIEQKWPTATDRMGEDAQIFAALYASLDAVKNPWRNATMHVENKYTGEEAEHIFAAVRGFTRKLSSRMDENGEPKA